MLKLSTFIITALLYTTVCAKSNDLIPIEAFAALPTVSSPQISPDGQHIIATSPIDGEEMVIVTKFGSVEMTPVVRLKKAQNRIESISWLNNERVLVRTSYNKLVYNRRIKLWRNYAVNLDGSKLVELQLPAMMRDDLSELRSSLQILTFLPEDNDHILVQTTTNVDKTPAVFKFNIYDNSVEKVVSATEEIDQWVATRNGEVNIGFKYENDKSKNENTVDIFFRADANSTNWEKIYSYSGFKDFYMYPVSISEDKSSMIVRTDYEVYKQVLRRFDIKNKVFGDILYEVDGYDISSAKKSDGKLVGVTYTDDFIRVEYFDDVLKQRQQMIQKTFAKYQSYIYDSSEDKNRLIVSVTNTDSPLKFFLVDLSTKKVSFWLSQYAQLEKKPLPGKQKFTYEARDGYELVGYLTPGIKGAKSPLVVLPHGGPRSRDTMHFDIFAQLLARRGYAVLQMNFRGSEGYGNGHEVDGYKQWGKLMQTDVYDAIAWVKNNKWADTSNKCIVGWSYGGYVALTAGFQQPKEFKCIVSVAGLSDLPTMVEGQNFWSGSSISSSETIGDITIESELQDLRNNSALIQVDKFATPVLLLHGENDQTVKLAQSEDLYKALKKSKNKVELIELDSDTHDLDNPKNRIIAFEAIDKFLEKYLD
jgi:dipeptidyl aminopeptidase/acylaminoacyl peptidase